MKRRYAYSLVLIFLLSVSMVSAQETETPTSEGGLPWLATWTPVPGAAQSDLQFPLPDLPRLQSPTPIVVGPGDGSPVGTGTPEPTSTPEPTMTPFIGIEVGDSIATLDAVMRGIGDPEATAEVTAEASFDDLDGLITGGPEFFGLVKGLSGDNVFGPFAPLLTFVLLVVNMTFFMFVIKLTLPAISVLIGTVRKALGVVMDFARFAASILRGGM